MAEINSTYNLNPYYTSTPRVKKPEHVVATPPEKIPEYDIYTDRKANKRLTEINADVYEDYKKTPKPKKKKFFGLF